MFLVSDRDTGKVIGLVEELRYICYDEESKTFFRSMLPKYADGIAVKGQPYNIGTEEKLKGYPFAQYVEVDGSRLIETLQDENKNLTTELNETQIALAESYEENAALEDELTQTQLALVDLYETL